MPLVFVFWGRITALNTGNLYLQFVKMDGVCAHDYIHTCVHICVCVCLWWMAAGIWQNNNIRFNSFAFRERLIPIRVNNTRHWCCSCSWSTSVYAIQCVSFLYIFYPAVSFFSLVIGIKCITSWIKLHTNSREMNESQLNTRCVADCMHWSQWE